MRVSTVTDWAAADLENLAPVDYPVMFNPQIVSNRNDGVELTMEPKLRELLREIETHGRENDSRVSERPRMMLNLEPASAELLGILVRARATRALEVGTSNAYSTIWLAWSLAPVGGKLISIDRIPISTRWRATICGERACSSAWSCAQEMQLKLCSSSVGRSIWCFWMPIAECFQKYYTLYCRGCHQKRW